MADILFAKVKQEIRTKGNKDVPSISLANQTFSTVYLNKDKENEVLTSNYLVGGIFDADLSDTTSLDDDALTLVATDGTRYKRRIPADGTYQIDWWFKADDKDDYSLTLNRLSEYLRPSNDGDRSVSKTAKMGLTLKGPSGRRICRTQFTLYAWNNNWDFNKTNLIFSEFQHADYCIWLRGAENATISNLDITYVKPVINNASVKKIAGIYLHTMAPNVNGVACRTLKFESVNIIGADHSICYGDNAYIHEWSNCVFSGYDIALTSNQGTKNTGENLLFNHCVLSNGVMYMDWEMPANFNFCSFDYSGVSTNKDVLDFKGRGLFTVRNATTFNNCHFEWCNENSQWYGPVFYGKDTVTINGGDWVFTSNSIKVSGYDYQQGTHPYFYEASDIDNARLIVKDFEIMNADLDRYAGAWGNGQVVIFSGLNINRYVNTYRNLWKTPVSDTTNYTNSVLPGMHFKTDSPVIPTTAKAAVENYNSVTRLYIKPGATDNVIDYNAADHEIKISTTSTNVKNNVELNIHAPISARTFPIAALRGFLQQGTVASTDLGNINISFELLGGTFDANNNFIFSQRLSWSPALSPKVLSYENPNFTLSTDYITSFADKLDPSSEFITHVQMKIKITNFYTKVANNPQNVEVVFKAPRMEYVPVDVWNRNQRVF